MQVIPNELDILQIGNEENIKIEKRSFGIVETTILTKIGSFATREMIITYYLWGKPVTLRILIEP